MKSRKTSTTSSIIDGRQKPHRRYDSFAPAPPTIGVVLDMSPNGRPPAPAPAPPLRRWYPPGPSSLQHELDCGSGPFSRPLTPHGAKVNGWVPVSGNIIYPRERIEGPRAALFRWPVGPAVLSRPCVRAIGRSGFH